MRSLSASELLHVWEQGLAQPPAQRALTLLAVACPDTPPEALARLSLGQRDAHLLTLRERTFGSELTCLATCPNCAERLELTFEVADIRATPTRSPPGGEEGGMEGFASKKEGQAAVSPTPEENSEQGEALSLSVASYEVQFRLPNSLDLVALTGGADVATNRQQLLERCLLAVRHNGTETTTSQLPAEVSQAVVAHMAQADPQADVQLALTCPVCDHQWPAAFDILSFFWRELNVWAGRLLREVHLLATAYGWPEADILAMSPWRRQIYLEMVDGYKG